MNRSFYVAAGCPELRMVGQSIDCVHIKEWAEEEVG